MNAQHLIAWGLFLAFVLVVLAVDLFVLHKKPKEISVREAAIGSLLPVGCAAVFLGLIYFAYQTHFLDLGHLPPNVAGTPLERLYPDTGFEAVLLFLTGYLVELSLSADNVFLFVLLMTFFVVPRHLQHRVLFWGVLGALFMRAVMIIAGAALLSRFEWIIYVFGIFLLFTGIKMLFSGDHQGDPSANPAVKIVRKLLPVDPHFHGTHFFIRKEGRLVATNLFLVLICIEFTDLVFALDSIPAIFGITRDPFIVFSSNVFAILGLRSMYFLLAGVMDKFRFLKIGLATVLGFVGFKMILPGIGELYGHFTGHPSTHWEIDKYLSLAVIIGALTISILASLFIPPAKTHAQKPHVA